MNKSFIIKIFVICLVTINASALEKIVLFGDSLMAGYGLQKEDHLSTILENELTKKGYDIINKEIDERWNVERPIVVEEVYQAALLGDRSENAAYIYGKQRLRKIDSRIRYLKRKISDVKVIDTTVLPQRPDIQFGAWVTVINEEDEETQFQLVDERESDPNDDRVSIQSPVGRALLGNTEGESVEVKLPKGAQILDIVHVYYGPDPRENQS